MKIIIQEADDKKPRTIRIPTRGLSTGLGPIALASGAVSVSGVEEKITYRQARTICRALVKGRKVLGGEPMVDVQTSDGTRVRVYL